MSSSYTPSPADTQVALIPGLVPNDGGDKLGAPRNIIAFAIILLFGVYIVAPYIFTIPNKGAGANLILTGGETLKTVVVLVLGFFFGTTVNANRQQDTIRQQALAAVPAPDPSAVLKVDPPATIDIKDPAHDPDAPVRADPAPAPAPQARVQPGDGGPAE